jgi:hypothetical protein
VALLPRNIWPYAIADAVAAKLYLWDLEQLGVAYTYADGFGEAGPVGSDDWPEIRRLKRAGRLAYRSDAARELAAKVQIALNRQESSE